MNINMTYLTDFPLTASDGLNTDFPKHDIVQDYLERYSDANGLPKITSFNTEADSVLKIDGKFHTTDKNGNLYVSKRLCVCTGFQGHPRESKGFEVSVPE